MNTKTLSKLGNTALLAASVLLAAPAGFASPIAVGFSPGYQAVSAGVTVNFDLSITGLGGGESPALGAYDLTIAFNPLLLGFQNATFPVNDALDPGGTGSFTSVTFNPPGTVGLVEISFADPFTLVETQPSTFQLANLRFRALKAGTAVLTLNINQLGDELGNALEADAGSATIDIRGQNPPGVPEPSTLTLLFGGAAGMILRTRKRLAK